MRQIIKYKCDHCGELFDSEENCLEHEDRHIRINKANKMLRSGHTLKEIQDECNIWNKVPEYLESVTTNNCFVVGYWQCCSKPAYQIDCIYIDGRVRLWGCGSWSGYFGMEVDLGFRYLKDPRPKEELFIDKRYSHGRW